MTKTINNEPNYYTWHPCGLPARKVSEEFSFHIGTALNYLWRHEFKHKEDPTADLKKAIDHINFEIERLGG